MAATLFTPPRYAPLSSTGSTMPGAKLFAYLHGTTTPQNTYNDPDLDPAHANTNPVVADANGLFGPIYLNEALPNYKFVLKTSADVTIWTEDDVPTVQLTQATIGAVFYPLTDLEDDNNVTPIRYWFPPGNLMRYTDTDGDGTTGIAADFSAMLHSGEKSVFIPTPEISWVIDSTVTWVAGVSAHSAVGTHLKSTVSSGQWTFLFDGIPYATGNDPAAASFDGFTLEIANAGAKAIQLWESRDVHLSNCEIFGPAGIGGTGIEINGGDDASPTWGAAHNSIRDCRIYRMGACVRLYTDNTTTPASNTAFSNRNQIYNVQSQACTEGLSIDRANTNELHMSLQANTEGADVGEFAKNNLLYLVPESNTRPIVLNTNADENFFGGTVRATDFVNGAGAAVLPNVATTVISSNTLQFPRDVTFPSGGGLRFLNPYGATTLRFRPGNTYDVDLCMGSHDASDVNFDLFCAKYDATAPYASVSGPLRVDQLIPTKADVASATNVTYVNTAGIWRLTGTTTVNTITAPTLGSPLIHILCTANTTINDDSTAAGNLVLAGGANLSCTADDTFSLIWNNTTSKWVQLGAVAVN